MHVPARPAWIVFRQLFWTTSRTSVYARSFSLTFLNSQIDGRRVNCVIPSMTGALRVYFLKPEHLNYFFHELIAFYEQPHFLTEGLSL